MDVLLKDKNAVIYGAGGSPPAWHATDITVAGGNEYRQSVDGGDRYGGR